MHTLVKNSVSVEDFLSHQQAFDSVELLSKKLSVDEAAGYSDALKRFSELAMMIQALPRYDVIGMDALVDRLRDELKVIHDRDDGLDSINKLSSKINVSRTYLAKFRDGGMVCMNIMNRIAKAFNIRYLIENYEDSKQDPIE